MITIKNEQELNQYQKFFQGKLKQHNIKSPAELKSDEEKRAFFKDIKTGWKKEKKNGGKNMSKVKEANKLVDDILDNKYNKLLEVEQEIDNVLYILNEEEITLDTFKDFLDDMRKRGYDDEKKLQGMLNKAKEIAKKQGKEGDRQTILGILQGFFQEK